MKRRDVIALREVADDLEDGRNFYNRRERDIGEYFFDSLISDLDSLRVYAGIHCKRLGSYRMMSRRFPFAIYYEVVDDIVRIVAVLDMRRDPAWIRKKLEQRGS